MMEPPMMTYAFKELVPVPDAPNDAVRVQDLTIDRLLKDHFPEIRFPRDFRKAPVLQRVTLRQVMYSPLALYDFLAECRTMQGCRETALRRLGSVVEMASAGLVDGASDHEDALEDLTIDRLLKDHFPETRFTKVFRKAPFLQLVTLGQVMSSPLALYDFLAECRTMPGFGEAALTRLRRVIEKASAGLLNGASDHEDAAVKGCVSFKDGRD
jgi:hypothetical protein